MRQDYVLSVTQLNEYVASIIGNDALLSSLSLRGEVSGFKRHTSGHLYFSMKDEKAIVRCVMFRQNALSLVQELRDGMRIVARGYASLYARDGQFQFYVKAVEEEGEGDLYRCFLELKARLEATGMFDPARKRELPGLPRCVGIVTSATGAAVQDIINVIRRRFPAMDIVFCPAKVQGDGAAQEIAAAIHALDEDGRADVIILGRGGGSLEDLWAFNEETVARAIYRCNVPIVSAVGHETDFTIADFVADLRAPTPSAAAELCVPEYEAASADVEEHLEKLRLHARRMVDAQRAKLTAFDQHRAFATPQHAARGARDTLKAASRELSRSAREGIGALRSTLDAALGGLETLAPQRTLERGFALIRTEAGLIGSAAALSTGQRARIVFHDGDAEVVVERVNVIEERI